MRVRDEDWCWGENVEEERLVEDDAWDDIEGMTFRLNLLKQYKMYSKVSHYVKMFLVNSSRSFERLKIIFHP